MVHQLYSPKQALPSTGPTTEDLPEFDLILAAPRGFCAGVRRAIDAVRDALEAYGPPVYVRRAIVHNLDVVRDLEGEGAIFVEELAEVPEGSILIFSAHGIAPAIATEARERGLIAFDAVCPLVAKVHRETVRHRRQGRMVVLIGHRGHPEIEGTLGHVEDGDAIVVSSVEEVAQLSLPADAPAAYAVQTTYSVEEAAAIVDALKSKFSDLAGPATSDICYATTNRQMAVRELAATADAILVAGASFSSNANRLAEVAGTLCPRVQLVAGPLEIDWDALPDGGVVGITAAASTPEDIVQAIVAAFADRFRVRLSELEAADETTVFKRLPIA